MSNTTIPGVTLDRGNFKVETEHAFKPIMPWEFLEGNNVSVIEPTGPKFSFHFSDDTGNLAVGVVYPVFKIEVGNCVWVLADATVEGNDGEWKASTDRRVHCFEGGFPENYDYEEQEAKWIAQEEKDRKKRDAEEKLAELIINLLDDFAWKDEEFVVKNEWNLSEVEVRGCFNFIKIACTIGDCDDNIVGINYGESEAYFFTKFFIQSFKESQTNRHVQLVDSMGGWDATQVYGGEYDLVKVAKDVIAYLANKNDEFEGGVNE